MGVAIETIVKVTRSLQVELKGRYSVHRMHEFKQYCMPVSYWHAAAVILAMPLPCLLLCMLVHFQTQAEA